MDASRFIMAKGEKGITNEAAIRIEIANALRDLADEIESGRRRVTEAQTFERIAGNQTPTSVLYLCSYLTAVPSMEKQRK